MESLSNPKVLCSVVCSVLMLAILVLMFVPFWSYVGENEETFEPETRTTSINGYLWFPSDHKGIEDMFNEPIEGDPNAVKEMQILWHFLSECRFYSVCLA